MARIILMRHGRGEFDFDDAYGRWLSANAMAELIDNYETTGLAQPQSPPDDTKHLAQNASYAVSSPLPRALASLLALRMDVEFTTDPVFTEVPMARPASLSFLGKIPLPVIVWSVLLRLLWWLRLAKGKEGYGASIIRTRIAALRLEETATQHGTVFLSGHGFFNHMLGKQLRKQGWLEKTDVISSTVSSGYWACKVFDKTLP